MSSAKMIHNQRKTRRAIKKLVTGAVLVSGLLFVAHKPARAASIELMAGNKSATVDLKASADITKKLGVFVRARPTIDYSGKISAFGLADLTVNLNGGLDAVGEVQLVGGNAVPRAGVQYFTKAGNFSFYTIATIGLDSKPYLESLTAVKYNPEIYKTLKLLLQIENVTDLDATGNVWSTQRARLGAGINGWGVGAAADLTETGNHPTSAGGTFGCNAGGFVSKAF